MHSVFFGKLMEYLQFRLPAAALLGCCRRFDASTTFMSLTQANSSVESFRLVKSHARPEGTQEWNQDRMLLGTFFFTGEKKLSEIEMFWDADCWVLFKPKMTCCNVAFWSMFLWTASPGDCHWRHSSSTGRSYCNLSLKPQDMNSLPSKDMDFSSNDRWEAIFLW